MRKDVRLALAVCSVLLFAVLVYVLFFTGPGTKKAGTSTGGGAGGAIAVNTNGGTKPKAADTAGGTASTGTTTADSQLTSVRPAEPIVTPSPAIIGAGAATRPVETGSAVVITPPPPAPAANLTPLARGENFDWGSALHRGLPGNGASGTDATGNATVAPAPGATPGQGLRKYQVKPNETLWAIARNEYGNAAYVNHIIRANPGIDPNRLRAGTIILLPEKTEVVPDTGSARLAVAAPTTRPIDPTTQYRVQSGDNLNTIAKKVCGNINRAGKIYEANKDLIGPNPNALKLNMVLRLPEPPTSPAAPTAAPVGTSPAISDLR